jgi:hypothetical protein
MRTRCCRPHKERSACCRPVSNPILAVLLVSFSGGVYQFDLQVKSDFQRLAFKLFFKRHVAKHTCVRIRETIFSGKNRIVSTTFNQAMTAF